MKKRKTKKKYQIVDGATSREYQEPELFKMKFQQSATCHSFRRAWHIPVDGFEHYTAYSTFHEDLRKKDRDYAASEKFLKRRDALVENRKAWAAGKITAGALDFEEWKFARFIPSIKYDEDLDHVVSQSKKPIYWRNFVEECLLFRNVESTFIERPFPEPKVSWNNDLRRNELTIENIFPDTGVKDFASREFTKKFKELQKKLPGYGPRPRGKTSFDFGLKILELENSGLSDSQKADRIAGIDTESDAFMKSTGQDSKDKNRVKSMRHRIKKRTGLI